MDAFYRYIRVYLYQNDLIHHYLLIYCRSAARPYLLYNIGIRFDNVDRKLQDSLFH